MRLAKKLGFLGLAMALVAAFGMMAGGAKQADAQIVNQTCVPATGSTVSCTFNTTVFNLANQSMVFQVTSPLGVTITGINITPACTLPSGIGTATVTLNGCLVNIPTGSAVTITFNAPVTGAIALSVTYNSNLPPNPFNPSALACVITVPTGTCTGTTGVTIVPPPPVGQINVTLNVPAGVTVTANPVGTIGTAPLQCSLATAPTNPITGPQSVVFTYTCPLLGAPNMPISIALTGITGANANAIGGSINVVGGQGPTTVLYSFQQPAAAVSNQPTDENKFCTNTTSTGNLSQVVGGSTLNLGVSGPAKNFTLPLFGGASTCLIQIDKGVAGGVANPCSATNPCSDGYIVVTLTTLGSGAAISCANGPLPTGQALPATPVNGGTCQQQSLSTQLNIPCGTTAGTPAANTTVSATCTGVLFDIQSALGSCINSPTSACPNPGAGFTGGTATVTVQFLATPANGGTVGGIQLGTNNFTFQSPGIGTLLVTASPQLIPSNGTLASVVTATFGCGTGFSLVNGFPLSSTSTVAGTLAQPILGTGQSAVCGAGLPGTFNFTTPGNVLFDNGRSSEAVSCGLNGQQNIFGGNNFFNPSGFSATAPLVFTCTGAAVLVIGAGAAGDAPINVTYTSAVGGLTAIGSTLITVSPSGVPRISVACNPSTIAAGNTGSLCTATVTDQNGVPLTGITGATVTFTVSDTTVATILPCVVNIPGAINITTSPNVVPQIVPNTPCVTPSGTIPGQENTFINGQATALLVASNYAHPETVTVSASLGVLIPPQFACLVSPYTPQAFGTILSGNSATSGVGLPSVTGCGFGNPVGFTGLASGFSVSGSGGLTGIVTLPNTTSASTTVNIGGVAGILIAGATTTSPLQLARGCNQVIVTSTNGTPIANIAALVSPTSAVVSIWRFNNGTKQFQAGFFSDPAAPTDFIGTGLVGSTLQGNATINSSAPGAGTQITESYFVCVNQSATIVSG